MGMFDTVLVRCPKCGSELEFQSKGGECIGMTYDLNDAPADVLSDVNRHSPCRCKKCGAGVEVDIKVFATPRIFGG